MNRFLAGLLAATLALSAPVAAPAQEIVQVGAVTATRVVIGPARTELARIIKAGLAGSYYGTTRDSRAYADAQKLYYFYGSRNFEPIWLTQSADGSVAFSPAAEKIIAVFVDAESEGFRPEDYLTPDLDLAAAGTDPQRLAAVETAFSASALRYAQHAIGGRVRPTDVNPLNTIKPRTINGPEMLLSLATSDDPGQILMGLHPRHPEFLRLKSALAEFSDGEVAPQVHIPDGKTLKPGMIDDRVPLLRQRLGLPEPEIPESATDAQPDLSYDQALVDAVTAFQTTLGLEPDGVAGPATIAALNGGSATSRDDILANMERWRWLPEDLGTFNVFVNIPEFRLAINDGGREVYTTRVVVGTPKNQTPSFSDEIEHIVVNPYWNVPPSIARNEIAPHLVSNPGYLDGQNMELLYNGKPVNPWAIDWSTTGVNNFRIRQRPGPGNALGSVKFLFPNEHDVYLHDTPSKSLFQRSYRAYSHGCVRVQNPMEFADALLQHTPDLNAAKLEAMYGAQERWVNLPVHIPVHLAYFTLRVGEDGTIRSYGDVYGENETLIALLND